MKKFTKIILIVFFALLLCVGSFYAGKTVYEPEAKVMNDHTELTFDNYLIVTNEYRLEKGLIQLTPDPDLSKYAQARAEEITSGAVKVGHTTNLGNYWSYTKDMKWEHVAECVQDAYDNARTALNDFKSSPTHNDTILNSSNTHIGIGIDQGVIVLEFGSK